MARILLFATLLIGTGLSQVTQGQNFTFRSVALEGQTAPGTGGGKFSLFLLRPFINDSGDVVFVTTINGGSTRLGIFLFSNGAVLPVALEGQEAPGTGGGKFTNFFNIAINNVRDVVFTAETSNGFSGIFLFSGQQITLVTRAAAGLSQGLSFNDAGTIAFTAGALFLISNGSTSQIAPPDTNRPSLNNKGEVAFVRQETRPFFGVVDLEIDLYSKGIISTIVSSGLSTLVADLNDFRDVAFLSVNAGDSQIGLFKNGSISTLVPPAHRALSPPDINNAGFIAFSQQSFNDTGRTDELLLFDGSKFLKTSAGEAPGTGGGKFSRFGGPSLNNLGVMAFIGSVTGGTSASGIFVAAPAQNEKLYFAQFGDGSQAGTSIFSQVTLVNLDSVAPENASIEINDDRGNPLTVDLNGVPVLGRKDVVIPANGALTLKTDGQGPIQTGAVMVSSDRKISGVILFAGNAGTAGVGDSRPLRRFVAPMEIGPGINTGIALMGLGQDQTIQLELRDEQGNLVANGSVTLGAKSHLARFITELQWDAPLNLSGFSGTLTATGTAQFAATVIRVSPGQFTTLPVAEKN